MGSTVREAARLAAGTVFLCVVAGCVAEPMTIHEVAEHIGCDGELESVVAPGMDTMEPGDRRTILLEGTCWKDGTEVTITTFVNDAVRDVLIHDVGDEVELIAKGTSWTVYERPNK